VYLIDFKSDGNISATIVTSYAPVSSNFRAVVRPTTPAPMTTISGFVDVAGIGMRVQNRKMVP
jgi:hypothetical protein